MEKRIFLTATVFSLALLGVIALSVRISGRGLPTCLLDVRPFLEGKVIEQAPKRYEIHMVARMWRFEPSEITVPPGSTADIYLSTADVTHGMAIVGTNVNLMAVPGVVNYSRITFDKPGDYTVVCNEYCGIAHHKMAAVIHVTDKAPPPPPPTKVELGGEELLGKYQCTACHTTDGTTGVGATFKGLANSRRTMVDGSVILADDAYLRESIEKPDARIVKGYEPMMPPIEIPPADLEAILEYLETLH